MRHFTRRFLAAFVLALLSSNLTLAVDGSVKGAFVLHPDMEGFENRWFVSVGGEWALSPSAYLGMEFQSAYRNQVVGGKLTTRFVPFNAFFTAKWKPPGEVASPYLAAGVGLVSALSKTEYYRVTERITDFDFARDIGFQLAGGVEIKRRWLIEFLLRRSFSRALSFQANPAEPELNCAIAGGIRW